jgi:hypothetical protein
LQRVHQSAIALVAFVILDTSSVLDNRLNFGQGWEAALHQAISLRLCVNVNGVHLRHNAGAKSLEQLSVLATLLPWRAIGKQFDCESCKQIIIITWKESVLAVMVVDGPISSFNRPETAPPPRV